QQIVEYANEFAVKLLPVEKTIIWAKVNDMKYSPVIQNGFTTGYIFDYNPGHDQIIHFHAGLFYPDDIKRFFSKEIVELNLSFAIPLVMDKSLYGILGVRVKEDAKFDSEDVIIAEALMNLYATALTNYKGYKDLERIRIKLDEKIFNLFAINQSTKALLSEKNLDNLYALSIGVFAELTQSAFTTFFMFDEKSETFKLKSARHVFDTKKNNMTMSLYPNSADGSELPVLINTEKEADITAFNQFFFNGNEVMEKIDPKYIVLLKKFNQIVGFVTLGEKVNGKLYDQSIFELIESMASSTYIAIINAMYIEHINSQKEQINNKLSELIRLNVLMKNINGASDCEQVNLLVIRTLEIKFGITMAFIAGWEEANARFVVKGTINIKNEKLVIPYKEAYDPLLAGENIIMYDENDAIALFQDSIGDSFIIKPSGLLMIPIYFEDDEDDAKVNLLGAICILSAIDEIIASEENMVKFDAIATHLAPVIYQLQSMEIIKHTYKKDYANIFREALATQIFEANDFKLDLYVVVMQKEKYNPFDNDDIAKQLQEEYAYVYPLNDGLILVIMNNGSKAEDLVMLYDLDYKMTIYQYEKDFNNVSDFLKLLG
ncbi:MAG: GAF domain-containing protein, partial [Vallitaleaceae bacterium]|nr:GAF domain-containing protein [Vallitaleaceae bacterium]